jgi:hypothetical protein
LVPEFVFSPGGLLSCSRIFSLVKELDRRVKENLRALPPGTGNADAEK